MKFELFKPIFDEYLEQLEKVEQAKLILPQIGYYFTRIFEKLIHVQPKYTLNVIHTLSMIVKKYPEANFLTDKNVKSYILDILNTIVLSYKDYLEGEFYEQFLDMIDLLSESGWVDGLDILYKLDEL